MILAAVDWLHYLFMIPLGLISVFLTLVILVQRGRGGGLTGALGGMGGASAFGTKAGDLFTKITIAVAFVWIVLSMAALKFLNQRTPFDTAQRGTGGVTAPLTPGTVPKSGTTIPGTTAPGSTKSGSSKSGSSKSGSTSPSKSTGEGSATTPPASDSSSTPPASGTPSTESTPAASSPPASSSSEPAPAPGSSTP